MPYMTGVAADNNLFLSAALPIVLRYMLFLPI